jgi:hypothetical protein
VSGSAWSRGVTRPSATSLASVPGAMPASALSVSAPNGSSGSLAARRSASRSTPSASACIVAVVATGAPLDVTLRPTGFSATFVGST